MHRRRWTGGDSESPAAPVPGGTSRLLVPPGPPSEPAGASRRVVGVALSRVSRKKNSKPREAPPKSEGGPGGTAMWRFRPVQGKRLFAAAGRGTAFRREYAPFSQVEREE